MSTMEPRLSLSNKIAQKLSILQFFTDREAWTYFRIAAFGEAIGWTSLISGITISRYVMPGSNTAVDIAGQFHGTIFLIYIVSVFAFCSSLHWTKRQTLIAALASIPPYGTLIFEKYMAHRRRDEAAKEHRQIVVRAIILNKGTILAIQPSDRGFWCLPGGRVKAHESSEAALLRSITAQTGITPIIQRVVYMHQYRHHSLDRLELFFQIANPEDYRNVFHDEKNTNQKEIDELEFIDLQKTAHFEPKFLLSEPLTTMVSQKAWTIKLIEEDTTS
jgi:integral membrane protein